MSQKYCILGLGLMGSRVARRLGERGHDVIGWNRTQGSGLDELARIVPIASSPSRAVAGADVIMLFLHDAPAVRQVVLDSGAAESIKEGALLADMGTNTPGDARFVAARLPEGVVFADAPVSGGTRGAENGTMSIFLGCAREHRDLAMAGLGAVGRVSHMGDVGAGQAAKLANQIVVACTIAGLGEGVAYAEALGVAAEDFISAMGGGLADSEILQTMGPRIIASDFVPRGRARTHLKDLEYAFSQVRNSRERLGAAATAMKYLQMLTASANGGSTDDLDHSAMVIAARKMLCRDMPEKSMHGDLPAEENYCGNSGPSEDAEPGK